MIKFQKWIKRQDLRDNPDVLYLFGDNDSRYGFGGQAKEMRNEPNALGIRTKWLPSKHEDAYFCEDYMPKTLQQLRMITLDLKDAERFLQAGGTVVVPRDGLGTGLSELPTRAPLADQFIKRWTTRMYKEYHYE